MVKLRIFKLRRDDAALGRAGDMILVDENYDWDPDKVSVLAVLKRGSDPGRSAYKSQLQKVTDEEVCDYLMSP